MKTLIIYESFFSNTEKIAQAIGNGFESSVEVEIRKVSEIKPEELKGFDLLIVGAPTRAFRPSPGIIKFLKSIPARSLQGVKAASFDTRIALEDIKLRFLRIMVKLFGYAAEPISKKLRRKGAEIIIDPEGFSVKDTEGPLKEGELERAKNWANELTMQVKLKL